MASNLCECMCVYVWCVCMCGVCVCVSVCVCVQTCCVHDKKDGRWVKIFRILGVEPGERMLTTNMQLHCTCVLGKIYRPKTCIER